MPNVMKAAFVREFRKPRVIEEMPIPEPADDQILVRFAATGVCWNKLENINDIFARMLEGKIDGRVVIDLQ